jgi:hypothetical protein
MQFWANYNMLWANPDYRGQDQGWVGSQVRAMAWAMRALGEAAYATPDNHPMKAYFVNHIQFNIDHQTSHEQASPNIFGLSTSDSYTWAYDLGGGTENGEAPWQDDFFTWTVGHLVEQGFTSATWLRDYKAKYPIDRLTHPDFCYVFAAMYTRQFMDTKGSPLYASWADVYLKNEGASIVSLPCGGTAMATALGIDPGEINSYREVTSYIANMYPALAVSVDSSNARGLQAWAVMEGRARKPTEQTWGDEPEWAIIPRSISDSTALVNLTAASTTIASGTSATLLWSTLNVTSCTASGGWTGSKATSGTETIGPLNANTTFTLSCSGPSGTTSKSVAVTISSTSPSPTLSLSASPATVAANGTTVLTWSSTNATSCTAGGGWSGSMATSGNQSVGPLTATTSFSLSCTGSGGSVTKSVSVTVSGSPPPPPVAPTVTLSASPATINANDTSMLTWSSTDASSCTGLDGWSGAKATSGSQSTGGLTGTTTYTLSCTGAGGTAQQSATVTVNAGSGNPGGGTGSTKDSGGGALGLLSLFALLTVRCAGLRINRRYTTQPA